MTVPSYEKLAPAYARQWAELVPDAKHLPALRSICAKLLTHKATYEGVAQSVWGRPDYWWYVAITDQMEGGGGANTYLGNGQSLSRVTTEVPAGRGPFSSFHDGAIDALRGVPAPTSVSRAAYNWEGFNGWGYLSKPITDPYLDSFSNLYTKGKYTSDHHYDPEAVSAQPGALTILKVLVQLDPTIQLGDVPPKEAPVADTQAIPTIDYDALAAAIARLQPKPPKAAAPSAPIVIQVPPPVAAAPALPHIDLASILAHLDLLMPIASMAMSFIPGAQPFVPLLAVLGRVAHAVADAQHAMATNPASVGTVLGGHLTAISALLQQSKGAMPQLAGFADVVAKASSVMAPSGQFGGLADLITKAEGVLAGFKGMQIPMPIPAPDHQQ